MTIHSSPSKIAREYIAVTNRGGSTDAHDLAATNRHLVISPWDVTFMLVNTLKNSHIYYLYLLKELISKSHKKIHESTKIFVLAKKIFKNFENHFKD